MGEALVLERNEFLARSLEKGVKTGLSDEARAVYAAPYPDARSRRPLLQWPREIPIDGGPADVAGVVARYGAWLGASPEVPKLLLTFETGTPLGSTASVAWARANVPGLVIEALGVAGHHAPEDPGPASRSGHRVVPASRAAGPTLARRRRGLVALTMDSRRKRSAGSVPRKQGREDLGQPARDHHHVGADHVDFAGNDTVEGRVTLAETIRKLVALSLRGGGLW